MLPPSKQLKTLNGKRRKGPPHRISPSAARDGPSQWDGAFCLMRKAPTSRTAAGVNP